MLAPLPKDTQWNEEYRSKIPFDERDNKVKTGKGQTMPDDLAVPPWEYAVNCLMRYAVEGNIVQYSAH